MQQARCSCVGEGFYPSLSVYGGISGKRRAGQSPAPTKRCCWTTYRHPDKTGKGRTHVRPFPYHINHEATNRRGNKIRTAAKHTERCHFIITKNAGNANRQIHKKMNDMLVQIVKNGIKTAPEEPFGGGCAFIFPDPSRRALRQSGYPGGIHRRPGAADSLRRTSA